jgi:hypothetical protein
MIVTVKERSTNSDVIPVMGEVILDLFQPGSGDELCI